MVPVGRYVLPLLLAGTSIALAQPAPPAVDGEALARAIETERDEAKRRGLLQQAAKLQGDGAARFVTWAATKWKAGGWEHLAPALGKIETPASIQLLMQVTRERAFTPLGASATEALGGMHPDRLVPVVWSAWVDDPETFEGALVGTLVSYPAPAFFQLRQHLEALQRELEWLAEDDPQRASRRAAVDRVTSLVASAFEATERPLDLLLPVDPASEPLSILRGIVRAIDSRVPSRAALAQARRRELQEARLAADGGPFASDEADAASESEIVVEYPSEMQEERQRYQEVLFACAARGEPRLSAEAFGALPLVLDALTEDWKVLLLDALESPERPLNNSAFVCLKRITGEDLPQTRNAWERHWTSKEAAGD